MSPLLSARKGSSKLALVPLALLLPQDSRSTASLPCDPTSLGVTVFAMLPRHLESAVFWRVPYVHTSENGEWDFF